MGDEPEEDALSDLESLGDLESLDFDVITKLDAGTRTIAFQQKGRRVEYQFSFDRMLALAKLRLKGDRAVARLMSLPTAARIASEIRWAEAGVPRPALPPPAPVGGAGFPLGSPTPRPPVPYSLAPKYKRKPEHPIFGSPVSVNQIEGSATFRRDDGTETELSGEMVVSIADSLGKVGALMGDAAKAMAEALMRVTDLRGALLDATETYSIDGPDRALELILADVREEKDPDARMKLAGEWITKITNGITELTREEE